MHTDLNDVGGRLSRLPGYDPPASGWAGVVAARAGRAARFELGIPAALAAVVLAVAVGLGLWLQSAQRALAGGPAADEAGRIAIAAEMRAENERLERMLAALPARHALSGSTAFTVAELEDRLALVDDRLSRVVLEPNAPERAEELWRERVGVMSSLVQVRYADAVGSY